MPPLLRPGGTPVCPRCTPGTTKTKITMCACVTGVPRGTPGYPGAQRSTQDTHSIPGTGNTRGAMGTRCALGYNGYSSTHCITCFPNAPGHTGSPRGAPGRPGATRGTSGGEGGCMKSTGGHAPHPPQYDLKRRLVPAWVVSPGLRGVMCGGLWVLSLLCMLLQPSFCRPAARFFPGPRGISRCIMLITDLSLRSSCTAAAK